MNIDELKHEQVTDKGEPTRDPHTSQPAWLKKVMRMMSPATTLIQRVPEPWRVKIMLPLAIVLLGLFIFKTYDLAFSDINKQKRILQDTWGQTAMVQWFHAGDEVRVYTYSRAMDNDFEHLMEARESGNRVGVKLVFGQDILENNEAFAQAVLKDVQQGMMGNINQTRATATLGIYEYHWTTLHSKVARITHGMAGFGVNSIMASVIFIVILIGALLILRRKIQSWQVFGAIVLMVLFMPGDYGNGVLQDEPTLIAPITPDASAVNSRR